MDKQREAFEEWVKREYPNRTDGYIEWHDVAGEYSLDEVQFAFESWKAAKGHDNHIGDVNEMVQAKPVARIKTVGGYPDDSRHELELLVKHGQLSDGQLLYSAAPPAQQAQWLPIETLPADRLLESREMFVVRGFGIVGVSSAPYSTDAYAVWLESDCGCCYKFVRWKHNFQPTHWMPLPPEPKR